MKAISNPECELLARPSVVAPGNYDGVHLGHRALIQAALALAETDGLRTVALTFDPHPTRVLSPSYLPPLLTTIARRIELLRLNGAEQVVVQHFGREFAALSPERFLQTSMIETLRAKAVVVGSNFRFGKDRSGDIGTLRDLGLKYGFEVVVLEPVQAADRSVSSSAVRQAVAQGEMKLAALLLDRFHEIAGEVVKGCGRGRQLGVPTANLQCDPVMQPPDGVYAVAARSLEPQSTDLLFGVANLGTRPTFKAGRSLEVHLFDFEGDLYGARLRIGFVERIREERAFANAEQLRAQIEADSRAARLLLQTARTADKEKLAWI